MFSQDNMSYEQFKTFNPQTRKQMITMAMQWGGDKTQHLLMMVYQHDPDAELREFARENLTAMGVTPPDDPNAAFTVTTGDTKVTLEGGDGQVKTGDALATVPDLFLLNKRNRRFAEGKSSWMDTSETFWLAVATLFLGGLTGVLIRAGSVPGIFLAIVALMTVAFFGFFVAQIRQIRLYSSKGQRLQGQIVSVYGRWHVSRDSNNRRTRSYQVSVTGVVKTPDGKRLDISGERTRNDLANAELPPAGTPLAVAYIDDDHKKIL